jgi:hypothetical protein
MDRMVALAAAVALLLALAQRAMAATEAMGSFSSGHSDVSSRRAPKRRHYKLALVYPGAVHADDKLLADVSEACWLFLDLYLWAWRWWCRGKAS